jgi:Na+/proline symporter
MMFLLFTVISFLAMAYIVDAGGGWYAAVERLALFEAKPDIISWHGMTGPDASYATPADGLIWAVVLGIAWSVVVAVSPWQASRYLMARSEHTVVRAGCGAGLVMLVLYCVLAFCGAAINLSNPEVEPPEGAIIWAALNLMPTFAGVLLMAGITAAALSSATTFLSLVGFSAANDLFSHESVDERRLLFLTRLSMFGIGLITLLLAWLVPPRIFWITYFAGTVFASSWGPVAFMSVWSRRITADAAFWGIVVGFVGNVVPKALVLWEVISLPVWADPIILGGLLSVVTIVLVSRRGVVTPKQEAYRARLHETPREEQGSRELARTGRWPWILLASGALLSCAMIAFYAIPYSRALGRSSLSLASGELWLSLGVGSALMLNGLLAGWQIRRWRSDGDRG